MIWNFLETLKCVYIKISGPGGGDRCLLMQAQETKYSMQNILNEGLLHIKLIKFSLSFETTNT